MGQYRKKPIEVEAFQWHAPLGAVGGVQYSRPPQSTGPPRWWIDTLEGWHEVSDGDWIVTGIKGEVYPVKPDIFSLTYEPVEVTHGPEVAP